jgi:hypothetical protein
VSLSIKVKTFPFNKRRYSWSRCNYARGIESRYEGRRDQLEGNWGENKCVLLTGQQEWMRPLRIESPRSKKLSTILPRGSLGEKWICGRFQRN